MTMTQSTKNLSNHASTIRAQNLTASDKINLAVRVMSKTENITQLAEEQGVSRKFLYDLADKAMEGLNTAFQDESNWQSTSETTVLFNFPVTKQTIRQIVVTLSLVCHSSVRNTVEFLNIIFDYGISVGTVFNILDEATEKAKLLNKQEVLDQIKVPALDEIYHCGKPVLVATDVYSTYVALLKQEESCDGTTWGSNLLDLSQKKKLNAEYSIADGGKGLRAGQKDAWPTVPCHADVFHVIKDLNDLRNRLEKRAYGKLTAFYALQEKLRKPKNQNDMELQKAMIVAKVAMVQAIRLADDVRILAQWMREDVLGKVGYSYSERYMLFNFIVTELIIREPMKERFIKPIRTKLENQRDDLLAFVALTDAKLEMLANEFSVPLKSIRKAYELHAIAPDDFRRYMFEQEARKELGESFHLIEPRIAPIIEDTVRASSCIENINSILRPYFFLRKQLGPNFLELLKFFLNHRPYARSEHPERVGKSPAELLTEKPHEHWLELLGFQLFRRREKAPTQFTEACA
jgi:hypothetical protein